jgi:hypothetical protein
VAKSFWDVCYSTEDIKTVTNGAQAWGVPPMHSPLSS